MQDAKQRALELADRYTYRVAWSAEDGEHVATCAEWPYLSWLEADQGAALSGLVRVVVGEVEQRLASGQEDTVPEPLSTQRFSGHFVVRVPPEVHRKLVIESAEQHISLNRLASAKLSR